MGYYWDELAPEVIWLGGGGEDTLCTGVRVSEVRCFRDSFELPSQH